MTVLTLCGLAGSAAGEPDWSARVGWWNDLFSELPPTDDSGFTNDFELELSRSVEWGRFGGRAFYRIITEQFRRNPDYARRRWDLVELQATAAADRRWRSFDLSAAARIGPTLAGNFGGRAIQDGWHRLSDTGASIEEGLQNRYEGDRRVALTTGATARAGRTIGTESVALVFGSALAGNVSVGGTGLSALSADVDFRVEVSFARWTALVGGTLGVARYFTRDPNLELAAAYGTSEVEPVANLVIGLARGRYAFGWEYRANEAGSGEPTGVVWFEIR